MVRKSFIRRLLAGGILLLAILSCQRDEALDEGFTVLTAEIEDAAKAAVSDEGVVTWNAGDAISVFTGNGFDSLVLVGEGGSSTGRFSGTTFGPAQAVALYPASSGHSFDGSSVSFHLADSYTYEENGNARMPMMALVSGTGTIKFRHIGGVLKVIYEDVPATADRFVFTALGLRVTGNFTAPASKNAVLQAETQTGNGTVTISFSPDALVTTRTFYVPLPTGTYSDFSVALYAGSSLLDVHRARNAVNVISKGVLLKMPAITVSDSDFSSVESYWEEIITWAP